MWERTGKYIAFSAALCMILSMVEYAIPKPVPFMRLGLANLPLILALFKLKKHHFFLLVLLKILAQALVSGTFFSYIFLFSFCGTFSAAFCMLLVQKVFKSYVSPVGISLVGSLGNTVVQLLLARFILFGEGTKYIAPIMLIVGAITGILLGVFAKHFMEKSIWFSRVEAY